MIVRLAPQTNPRRTGYGSGTTPEEMQGPTNVVQQSGKAFIMADGALKTYGEGNFGQLGNGTYDSSDTPVLVEF